MKHVSIALMVGLAALAGPAGGEPKRPARPPQPDQVIDGAVRAQVIDGAIAALHKYYVFPEVAAKLESSLRARVAAHAYDRITSANALVDTVTRDLQAVSHDKHMRMRYSAEPVAALDPEAEPTAEEQAQLHAFAQQVNAGFVKAERLDGNIGYLRLDYFLPAAESGSRITAAMTFVADTDALILDLRNNHGGDPATVALLISYLYDGFADVHLNDIYDRPNDTTRQYWVLSSVAGPRYAGKPVYVLTSGTTFSGGEECSYDLQVLKRATLVGEVTGGGANPGGEVKVGDHFTLFVPTGRAINPMTKTNWEGVGVKPDVAATAAKALDVAYADALRKQRARIQAMDAKGARAAQHLAREIDEALAGLSGKR